MNWKATLAALGAFATLSLEGSQAAHAGFDTDACSLLTPAQVSVVLGARISAGEKLAPGGTSFCGSAIPGEKSLNRKRVVLSSDTQLGGVTSIERFNDAETAVPGTTKEPVIGVGEGALFAMRPGLGTRLIFRKGERAYDLRVYGFPEDEIKAKEKGLADCVIQRLTNGRFTGDCPG